MNLVSLFAFVAVLFHAAHKLLANKHNNSPDMLAED